MQIELFVLIAIIWYITGLLTNLVFLFKDFDEKPEDFAHAVLVEDCLNMLMTSFLGPIIFLIRMWRKKHVR